MESLQNLFRELPFPPKVKENLRLFLLLKKVFQETFLELKDTVEPLYFEEGVLYLGVSNHYQLQELSGRYLEILERLKKGLPENERKSLKNIRFLWKKGEKNLRYKKEIKFNLRKEELEALKVSSEKLPDRELALLFSRLFKTLSSLNL